MGTLPAMFKSLIVAACVATAAAAGGLNISSLAVNAPKGHIAKVSLAGGNSSTYNIGILGEADFAIMKGDSKLVDLEQDGAVHITTKQFSTGMLDIDGYMNFDGVRQWKLFKQENFAGGETKKTFS